MLGCVSRNMIVKSSPPLFEDDELNNNLHEEKRKGCGSSWFDIYIDSVFKSYICSLLKAAADSKLKEANLFNCVGQNL